MSRATFKTSDLPTLGQLVFKLFVLLKLIDVEEKENGEVSINNLTIINFVLKIVGPTHEATLTHYIILTQVGRLD